ncbi:response regulator transcription factor [Novosphingobium sp. BL-8H]|uniref:LuxR C-terminal-related transcriptional regulator n=1 Tax=Novosphingobium sp. BL-8H TaxID=3127640 RepID=UPI003757B67A
MSTAIFVAVKNSLAHEGLCRILSDTGFPRIEGLKNLAAFSPAAAARHENAILIVDRSLCEVDGAATLGSLLKRCPRLRVVVLVETFDFAEMAALYMAGAHAYFLINSPCQALVAMMQMVAVGQKVAPPEIIDLVGHMLIVTSRTAPNNASLAAFNFNAREREVLDSLRNGLQNKTIAYDLNLSEAAIKATVKSILTKMGARNRTQAAVMAREMAFYEPQMPFPPVETGLRQGSRDH